MKMFLNNMVLTAVLVSAVAFALTGCKASDANTTEEPDYRSSYGHFTRIGDCNFLVYDNGSKVLYYKGRDYIGPYYNEHGQLCRYVDGQIVPIE